jgi:hypothetical protein
MADRAFQWLVCSWRPLTPNELVEFVSVEPGDGFPEEIKITFEYLLEVCNNWITISGDQSTKYRRNNKEHCRFSHLSIQEYLEQVWSQEQANTLVAKVCLGVILDNNYFKSGFVNDTRSLRERRSGRSDIYFDGWFAHVSAANDSDPSLSYLLTTFLGLPTQSSWQYRAWIDHLESRTHPKRESVCDIEGSGKRLARIETWQLQPKDSALRGVVYFKLDSVLQNWLGSTEMLRDYPELKTCISDSRC